MRRGSSASIDGRPVRRDFYAQYRRNPSRRQWTTVSGLNAHSTLRHSGTVLAKTIQKMRSVFVGRTRFTERFSMMICWRRARFSKTTVRGLLAADAIDANRAQSSAKCMGRMLSLPTKKANYFNRIWFSGGTARGRDKRPEFDALSKAAVRREFDVVLAWSVDRLGRSLQHLVSFLGEIHAKRVDLYLHQQGIDTTTPSGKAMFQMCGVFAEFERAVWR